MIDNNDLDYRYFITCILHRSVLLHTLARGQYQGVPICTLSFVHNALGIKCVHDFFLYILM